MDGNLLRFNKNITYALIDLETFNLCLHFFHNRPWQVGLLEVFGDKIVDAKDIRVNWPDAPHLSIGKEAAVITRFNQSEHNKVAIAAPEAFVKFWPTLKRVDHIIMHNGLKFDLYLLKAWAELMGEDWRFMMPKIIDTRAIAQGIKMGIPYKPQDGTFLEYQYRMVNVIVKGIKTSLKVLGPEYGIEHDYANLHDAIVDLELNLKIWNKLKQQIDL
jgi:DNA polymerase III epsilon subunit-like protein